VSRSVSTCRVPIRGERRAAGYSLLELMIALGLLTTLLAVAWSILGTLASAQLRGMRLAERLQVGRTLQGWLQDDLTHAMWQPTELIWEGLPADFVGDAQGFRLTILPSLEPLPWLAELLDVQSQGEVPQQPWPTPRTPIQIEYRFSTAEQLEQLDQELQGDPQFDASRAAVTPLLDEEPLSEAWTNRFADDASQDNQPRWLVRLARPWLSVTPLGGLAGPRLDASDLYRRRPAESAAGRRWSLEPGWSSQLPGIGRLRFRYHGGGDWQTAWNSRQSGRLPRAIEIAFDTEPSRDTELARPPRGRLSSAADPAGLAVGGGISPTSGLDGEELFEYRVVVIVEPSLAQIASAGSGRSTDPGRGR
jgi:type II secretory pathway component PulJ